MLWTQDIKDGSEYTPVVGNIMEFLRNLNKLDKTDTNLTTDSIQREHIPTNILLDIIEEDSLKGITFLDIPVCHLFILISLCRNYLPSC